MLAVDPQLYSRNLAPAAARQRLEALAERLRALPGADGVAEAVIAPLGSRVRIDHPAGLPHIWYNPVGVSYFPVMNLPLLRGRLFEAGDASPAVVSESAARAIWPGDDPIGKTLLLAGARRNVVGVVKDSGASLLADADSVEAYLPDEGPAIESSLLVLHTAGDPATLARLAASAAAAANETAAVSLLRTWYDNNLDAQRRLVTMIGAIGAIATALAAAGMFALVAFTVAQRRRELGIRLAIGAGRRHILGVLLGQNVKPTAIGAAAGVVLALVLTRLVRSLVLLHKQQTMDPAGFAAGLSAFAAVAVLATLSPARRALRIDPAKTLREE
jgi:hypothetical protein